MQSPIGGSPLIFCSLCEVLRDGACHICVSAAHGKRAGGSHRPVVGLNRRGNESVCSLGLPQSSRRGHECAVFSETCVHLGGRMRARAGRLVSGRGARRNTTPVFPPSSPCINQGARGRQCLSPASPSLLQTLPMLWPGRSPRASPSQAGSCRLSDLFHPATATASPFFHRFFDPRSAPFPSFFFDR